MNRILLVLIGFSSIQTWAGTCQDLKSCTDLMNELTGENYIFSSDGPIPKIGTTKNFELTKENAELVFTAMLDQADLARAPVGDGKTYRIVSGGQRKEMELPIVEASSEKMPTFPNNWDWITMRYKVKSPETATYLEQMYRLHVPRMARMQADGNAGLVIVSGNAPMVRNMYNVLKGSDQPLSGGIKSRMQEDRKRREQIEINKSKNKGE